MSCVGPHADNSEVLSQFITKRQKLVDTLLHGQKPSSTRRTFPYWKPRTPKEVLLASRCIAKVGLRTYHRLLKAVISIIDRPYFRRAWIIQEVALARYVSICCGMDVWTTTQWHALLSLLGFELDLQCNLSEKIGSLSFGVIPRIWQSAMGESSTSIDRWLQLSEHDSFMDFARTQEKIDMPMFEFVKIMKQKECCDPRDRIYAGLQLIDWGGHDAIEPTYGSLASELGANIATYLTKVEGILRFWTCVYLVELLELDISDFDDVGSSISCAEYKEPTDTSLKNRDSLHQDERHRRVEFETFGVRMASNMFSSTTTTVWYRSGFEPCRCSGTASVDRTETRRRPGMSAFERYKCRGTTYHDEHADDLASAPGSTMAEWVIFFSTYYRWFAIIVRKSPTIHSYTTVGYMLFTDKPIGISQPDAALRFALHSEPIDALRLAIVSKLASADRLDDDETTSFVRTMDRIEIFRSLRSTEAVLIETDTDERLQWLRRWKIA